MGNFKNLALCAAVACLGIGAHAQELVTNGGFETSDFTGWSVTEGATSGSVFVSPFSPLFGTYDAEFNGFSPYTGDRISQTLTDVVGATYTETFYRYGTSTLTQGNFQAYINGTAWYFENMSSTVESYTGFQTSFIGTGSDTISFTGGAFDGYYLLDGVSVVKTKDAPATTPEPGMLAMLSGLGIAGGMALRRRRSK